MTSPRRTRRADTGELFAAILSAPDRDFAPGARPVISYSDRDESSYLAAIEACALSAVTLERRGVFHGEWAELDPASIPRVARARKASKSNAANIEAAFATRWHAAKPIVLPGIASEHLQTFGAEIEGAQELHACLSEKGGLKRWLDEHAAVLDPSFRVIARRTSLHDRERDIDRVRLESFAPSGRGRPIDDLWLKSSWLSTHDDDASLRLRFSFGREAHDDASRDILRHRLVAELAQRMLPECALITENADLVPLVERLCGEAVLFTQDIAYWNSPQGGASFHHDAFAEDAHEGGAWRQLGVCYLQLSGATAWLALSIDDLARRVREFVDALFEGEMPWVRAQLFESARAPFRGGWNRLQTLLGDGAALATELALPGCGELGPLVNRGPEFTSFLADAGHAWILGAGDAILLPNQGLHATCMHSVFCASAETGYSLSLAMRPDREAPEVELERRVARNRHARGRRGDER